MSEFFDKTIDRSNTPNGKTSQTFYFKTHYEAKHAIGKQHIKRIEFESRPGIVSESPVLVKVLPSPKLDKLPSVSLS